MPKEDLNMSEASDTVAGRMMQRDKEFYDEADKALQEIEMLNN